MHKIFIRLVKEDRGDSKNFYVPLEQKRAPAPLNQPLKVKKMPTAFILLNTEIGAENQVLNYLRNIDGVDEAHGLWGVYDLIVNVQAKSMDELKEINKRISGIGQINSKLTMLVSERSPMSFMKKSPEPSGHFNGEPMSILV